MISRQQLGILSLSVAVQLGVIAHAAPPIAYDQWQAVDGDIVSEQQCGGTQNPSGNAIPCPAGYTCATEVAALGFLQRTVAADDDGGPYFQTIITEKSDGSGALVPSDESFVRSGANSGGVAGKEREESAATTPASANSTPAAHGPYAYLASSNGSIIVINLSLPDTLTYTDTLRVSRSPFAVAVSPNGAFLYASNNDDSTISVIRAFDRQVIDTIAIPTNAAALMVDGAGERLYVTHTSGIITVVDLRQRQVLAVLNLAATLTDVVIHPDDAHLIGLDLALDEVQIIDALTGEIVTRHPVPNGTANTGQMAVSRDGATVYLALSDGSSTTLHALDLASRQWRVAPQTLIGIVTRLFFNFNADRLLVNTYNPDAAVCSNARNGFYAIDTVSLLPTLVRDLARGEEVIASEASDSTLVLNRQTSRLHRLSADALTAYGSVGTGSNANAGEHFIGPVLAAALDTDTALLDFGTTAAGNTSTKRFTLRNSGALPITVTGLRLSAEAAVAAALTSGEFTVSKDDCSGRTLLPDDTCDVEVMHQPTGDTAKHARLQITTDSEAVSAAVDLTGQGADQPAATATGSGGGGVFAPYWLIALLLIGATRRRA